MSRRNLKYIMFTKAERNRIADLINCGAMKGVDIPIPIDMTVASGYVNPNRDGSEEAMRDTSSYHLPVPFDDRYALDYQFRRLNGPGAENTASIIIFHGIKAAVDHMMNYARLRMYAATTPDGWITRWQERLAAVLDTEKTVRENNQKREQTYEEFVQSLPTNPWDKRLSKSAKTKIGLSILIGVITIILAIEYILYYC